MVWTRLLSLLLGGTVYTFSLILAVFLTGLGLGSGAGAFLARGRVSPRLALGACQLLLALAAVDEVRQRFGAPAITRAVLLDRGPGLAMPVLPDA